MPSRSTIFVETNVAATPVSAQNPVNPPIIVGFRPETITNTSTKGRGFSIGRTTLLCTYKFLAKKNHELIRR